MKIVLFRFEKEKINFVECNIDNGSLTIGNKEKIFLMSTGDRGEKYSKILDELLQIKNKYSADLFAYQSPQKYRGAIKDEEGFANSAIFNLFCYLNRIRILELTPSFVRKKLNIPNKDFKPLVENEKDIVSQTYKIAKSDKVRDGLVFLSLIKNSF